MATWTVRKNDILCFYREYAYACNLKRRLDKHFKNAGVASVSFHNLRHTHTTIMLYAGVQPKDLQHRLDHSDISMTLNTYVHTAKEGARKSASIFESTINSS